MLFAIALPAAAITGGEPDGNRHPNVGLILFNDATGRFRCSATLVSPSVLITAAHCTDGTLGSTLFTFDSVIALQPPSPFPVAADPSVGYTPEEIMSAGYLSGTAYTHPRYSGFTDLDKWNDVGVIMLDAPVTGITPATLAPTNYLDLFAQPLLNKTIFEKSSSSTATPTTPTAAAEPALVIRAGRCSSTATSWP
jgi:hypothetical protein